MYLTYALPGLADPELQPPPMAYDRNLDHMVYASSGNPSRAPYEATSSVYSGFGSRKLPEVSAYNPQQGIKDSHIHVYLESSSDLLSPIPLIASLMFARRRVPATLTRLETRKSDVYYKYVATANAPSFAETGSLDASVPVKLQLQDDSGLDVGLIDVGPWLYEGDNSFESLPVREASRKRKTTDEPPEMPISVKRGTPPADESPEFGSYGYSSRTDLTYPPNLRSIDLSTMQRKLTPYGRLQDQQAYQEDSMYNLARNASPSQPLMRPPTTQSSTWNQSYSMGYQAGRSNVMREQTYHASPLSSDPANPPLVRASTLQAMSGSGPTPGAASDGSFNPYALYTTKAVIKIRGDLNTMQDDWDADERVARRRLVLFRGEQNGNTINTYFRAAKPDERPSTQATRERRISCIYWEERDEYFVTSVDTIALLETLVGARFTVEEKNRIRRNLETHHPLTVSKGKSDTESFFKVIMGFPNPKPRNIEKDVKVFPWPILAQALRKVISKYVSDRSGAFIHDACTPGLKVRSQQVTHPPPGLSLPLDRQATHGPHPPNPNPIFPPAPPPQAPTPKPSNQALSPPRPARAPSPATPNTPPSIATQFRFRRSQASTHSTPPPNLSPHLTTPLKPKSPSPTSLTRTPPHPSAAAAQANSPLQHQHTPRVLGPIHPSPASTRAVGTYNPTQTTIIPV